MSFIEDAKEKFKGYGYYEIKFLKKYFRIYQGMSIDYWDRKKSIYIVADFESCIKSICGYGSARYCHVWKIYPHGYAKFIETVKPSQLKEKIIDSQLYKVVDIFYLDDTIISALENMGYEINPNGTDNENEITFKEDQDFFELTGKDNSLQKKRIKKPDQVAISENQWIRARDYQ
ncbi:MAG: hypothetical protein GTO02_22325 [Candidatus Dadabacteria bacterium]|nr:hypothetical protein [Candidatus Dadabacteria bacterium]